MMGNPQQRRTRHNQRGFSVAELLTTMVMFSVAGAAITSVLVGTLRSVGYQTHMTDVQLDAATALALIQDDLRAAGYINDNMNQNVFQQLTSGTAADSIQFVGDVNSDDVSERITYAIVGGYLKRTQDTWNGVNGWVTGTAQPVAANVTNFNLRFYLVDPCTAAISQQTAAQVLASGSTTYITITLTATGTYQGRTMTRTLSSDVAERQGNVLPSCT
jgi:type II secretory pathway component PulJ